MSVVNGSNFEEQRYPKNFLIYYFELGNLNVNVVEEPVVILNAKESIPPILNEAASSTARIMAENG